MHEDESDLIKSLQAWRIELPSAELAARIAAEASRHAQRRSFGQRVTESLERLLTDWRYGLPVKAGALVACVMVGFAMGQLGDGDAGSELNVVAIAFGQQDEWERGL